MISLCNTLATKINNTIGCESLPNSTKIKVKEKWESIQDWRKDNKQKKRLKTFIWVRDGLKKVRWGNVGNITTRTSLNLPTES